MFFRIVTAKSRGKEYLYLKLLHSYRDGEHTKHRIIANLGKVDGISLALTNELVHELNGVAGLCKRLQSISGLDMDYVRMVFLVSVDGVFNPDQINFSETCLIPV